MIYAGSSFKISCAFTGWIICWVGASPSISHREILDISKVELAYISTVATITQATVVLVTV